IQVCSLERQALALSIEARRPHATRGRPFPTATPGKNGPGLPAPAGAQGHDLISATTSPGRSSSCGRGDDTICPKLAATLAQAEEASGESPPVTPMTQPSPPKAGQQQAPALARRAAASRQPPSPPRPAGQTAAVRQRRRSRRWLAAAGYAVLALACVLAGSITLLLVAAPVDGLRG